MDQHTGRTPHPEEPAEGPDIEEDAPLGGDETTEEQLTADNAAEEDTLRTLDPDDNPA
ncbi:hypothetical protein OED01_02055 [Microbacterium sp. M28]|uniref:hypothetical protein n=1 Tax=Microbacterium sp. M28 TaxID=2962064 RepID=UPI0021F40928|nr:hypothetical protein [Microbacterium sp. M28]UYO97541.1 hypothetical protein OED01_02055 [Microbacterium sp. M28]